MVKNNKKRSKKCCIDKFDQNGTSKEVITENLDLESKLHTETTYENKITYPEDDSDHESKPPKKKKKKNPVIASSETNKKGKKSVRQMKKEKYAQRQAEAQAAVKDQHKSQCLSYLSQWKHDRQNWKFMKAKQVWLYKNKFSQNLVPDASWPTLLEYFESAKGNIRNVLLDDANKIIKTMDDWAESQKNEKEDPETVVEMNKPDEVSYKRARDLIQHLQE